MADIKDLEGYKRLKEPDKREKAENWRIAIGLQQVDGLTPSKYLIELAKENIEGKISIDEATKQATRYYKKNPPKTDAEKDKREADEVSARITKLLSNNAFVFSPAELISIHKFLFKGILNSKTAGKLRKFNIRKSETILNGDTVIYGNADNIKETLDYDFAQEKEFSFKGLTKRERVEHIAKFMSGLWQIHPFAEGNTRTTATFIIKYLRMLGFSANNDFFEKNALYLRNALVRANYSKFEESIKKTIEFLYRFFGNMLLGEENVLDNRDMQITQKTTQKILDALAANPSTTRKELAGIAGISEDGIKWNLNKLRKEGRIKRIGPDKGGHWEVIV